MHPNGIGLRRVTGILIGCYMAVTAVYLAGFLPVHWMTGAVAGVPGLRSDLEAAGAAFIEGDVRSGEVVRRALAEDRFQADAHRVGQTPTRRTASSTPGRNETRSLVSWRMVSVSPGAPRITSW